MSELNHFLKLIEETKNLLKNNVSDEDFLSNYTNLENKYKKIYNNIRDEFKIKLYFDYFTFLNSLLGNQFKCLKKAYSINYYSNFREFDDIRFGHDEEPLDGIENKDIKDAIEIFYAINNIAQKEAIKSFSAMQYFKIQSNKEICLKFEYDNPLTYEEFKTKYYISEDVDYVQYYNYISACTWNRENIKTDNIKFKTIWIDKLIDDKRLNFPNEKINKYFVVATDNMNLHPIANLGIFISDGKLNEEEINHIQITFNLFISIIHNVESKYATLLLKKQIQEQQLRTAIISILVDSFAHNISAHSLVALENWFRKRSQELEGKIYINQDVKPIRIGEKPELIKDENGEFKIKNLNEISKDLLENLRRSSKNYYEILGIADGTNNEEWTSFNDVIRLKGDAILKLLTTDKFPTDEVSKHEKNGKFIKIPVPIDYAIFPFFKFLKGKAAFWSGVTRDMPFGGESISIYSLLYDELINNPLYIGTIVASEGITKVNFRINFGAGFETKDLLDFAQIDLDIINKNTITDNSQTINSNKDSLPAFKTTSDVEFSSYSFVKFGKDFKKLRETLKNEYAFMPGGIVGIHSFLTIIENTLRNVKHYKHHLNGNGDKLEQNGVDLIFTFEKMDLFHIKISEANSSYDLPNVSDDLKFSKKFNDANKLHRLYRIGVGIGHKIAPLDDLPENKIRSQLYNEIISNDGRPKLGGTSQDKVCASMLLNNKFMSVEGLNSETPIRDYFYYTWIGQRQLNLNSLNSGDFCEKKHFDILRNNVFGISNESIRPYGNSSLIYSDISAEQLKLNEKKRRGFNDDSQRECIDEGDLLFKFFNIWKADDIYENNTIENDIVRIFESNENPSRFKFNLYKDEQTLLNARQRQNSGFRMLVKPQNNPIKTVADAYSLWNEKLFTKNVDLEIQELTLGRNTNTKNTISFHNNSNTDKVQKKIKLAHGGNTDKSIGDTFNFRSHGKLLSYFANNNDIFKGIQDSVKDEFFEIMLTRVKIWDNRIYNLYEDLYLKRYSFSTHNAINEKFKNTLSLEIYDENNDTPQLVEDNDIDFHTCYVIHYSYLEKFEDVKDINELIEKKFIKSNVKERRKNLFQEYDYYRFSIIIISGKGSIEWYGKLKEEYKAFTFYRPIESLQNAVAEALNYGDDFQLKYNIIKTLFGN